MKLDYGTSLSPLPIQLLIGTIKKPTLREIAELTFDQFNFYELFLKLTPDLYYTQMGNQDEKEHWKSLTDKQKDEITTYDIILGEESLRDIFVEIFNFFFVEKVIFIEDAFVILKHDVEMKKPEDIAPSDAKGIIYWENFDEVINIIQQICCINDENDDEEDITKLKFKNEKARKMYIRMKKAEKEQKLRVKNKNSESYTIPNIISKVSSKHPSINLINVWDLTIFQLFDKFNGYTGAVKPPVRRTGNR